MTVPLAHTGHYAAYGLAVVGIVALFGYDWIRQRRRS
jgi:hypothetical protein